MVPRVTLVPPRPVRARNVEEKKRRRADILMAAERLWLRSTYADLSMNQVAREAGLAKGTLYLYFSTKEELFLALLSDHLKVWLEDVLAGLEQQRPSTPDELADFFIQSVMPEGGLRRLLILLNTVIDPSISAELSQDFRQRMLRHLLPILEVMPFDKQTNLNLLMHLYALAVGWHLVMDGSPLPDRAAGAVHAYPRPSFEEAFPVACRALIHTLAPKS